VLELRGIGRQLGKFSLKRIDLRLREREYFVLLGPSGAGKTVLLEVVAGLTQPDSGQVLWDGKDITSAPPERRGFAVVYQDNTLFPHLSVAGNIRYGLRARGYSRRDTETRAKALAETVGVTEMLARRPEHLSGGEQQRVALARALAAEPAMLLLDEPLSSLDPTVRASLRHELKRIHNESGAVFLHVTHDTDEALHLADRVGVILDGALCQVATPDQLFRKPSNPEVAAFLGMRNILSASLVRPGVCNASGVEVFATAATEETSFIWIQPEEILLSRQPFDSSARNQFRGTVGWWEHSGVLLAVTVCAGPLRLTALITHASFEGLGVEVGRELYCTFKSSAVHCF
jgi:molybdate/tungstate transport system ATP-binding protein